MTEYEHQVTHLMKMSKMPGFRDYLLQRLLELDAQPMFKGIKADLFQRVRDEKEKK